MADKRILQQRVVKFGITGMDEVYEAQRKIKNNAKAALKDQKDLLAALTKGTKEYAAQAKNVDAANKYYERQKKLFDDLGKQANTVLDIINNKTVESGKKLEIATKSIMKGVKSISLKDLNAGEAEALRKHIAGLVAEMTKVQAQAVAIGSGFQDMTAKLKTNGLAYEELSRYIKVYEQYGQTLATNYTNSSQALAKMGENATNAKIRMGQLDGTLLAVNKNTNAETLQAYIKGWQEIAKYSGASSEQIKRANENIAKAEGLMREMMQRRVENAGKTDFSGKAYYSPAQIREAVEYMKQYVDTTKMSTAEREKWNALILQGDQYLKQLTLDQQRHAMSMQLGGKNLTQIKVLSDAALASQKKYWTDMVANAQKGTAQYDAYYAKLKAVTEEEKRRASEKVRTEGAGLVQQVNSKTGFQGTIREAEEAVKKIQEYKKELQVSGDAKAIKETEKALATLNEKLAQTRTEVLEGAKTFTTLRSAAKQGVDAVTEKLPASAEKLRQMRENLEAYKKSLKNATPEKLQQINTVLTAIDRKEKEVAANEIKWSQYKGAELKKRSLDELRKAYDVLKKEIETLSPAQAKYNEKAMQMRQINERVKQLNKNLGHHVSSLENAASRLKNYVMIYLGFNAVMMKTRQLMSDVMKLSDQMVNVQKVTQMTNDEVERLVKSIQDLDTRSSTESLMAFAEQAGKLGIYAKNGLEGMKQFVEMGDRISKTLGEDIGGAQAIADLAKVNDIMNVTGEVMKRTGNEATVMRDALNATGSAILNVGNNSAASYGAITEYVGRLGAISASSGIAIQETVALGGALDALKMPAEAGSTALSQFINAIVRNTDAMAQAAKVSVVEMRNLIANGQTYKAVTLLLSKVADGTTTAQKLMDAMTGRSRTNVNIRNVIQLLSGHMELLNNELNYAKQGFESAFSQKTANDVQLIMSAMRQLWSFSDGTTERAADRITDLIYVWKEGVDGMGKDIPALAKDLSRAGYDVQMLESALRSMFNAMDQLNAEGKLTVDTMQMLATSTGQASIMEQEFERVNESAAARFERLGRMMHEFFVNPESVKFWSDMSKGIMDFIEWMNSGTAWARTLGTAITMLITYLTVMKMRLEEIIAVKFLPMMNAWIASIEGATVSTMKFRRALVSLKTFLASNWITLAATAVAGLVYWLKSAHDESTRFAKATAEANEALNQETKEAAMLFAQLKNTNSASAERIRLIDLINSKYGLILKNMKDETQFAKDLAAAYKLVVTQIKEKSRAQLGESLFRDARESATKKQTSAVEGINTDLEKLGLDAEATGEWLGSLNSAVTMAVADNANASIEELYKNVTKNLPKINIKGRMTKQKMAAQSMLDKHIKELIEGAREEVTTNERVAQYLSGYNAGDIKLNERNYKGYVVNTAKKVSATISSFKQNPEAVSDEELSSALEQMNYVLSHSDLMKGLERDKGSAAYKNVKLFSAWARRMSAEQTRRAGITPWGDSSTTGKPMEEWTTEALQAYHDKLKNTAIAAAPGADWSQIFPDILGLRAGMKVEEVQKLVDEADEEVQRILESRHMGLNDFKHPNDKDGGKSKIKTEMKEDMDATLKNLEEYYERRNMLAEKYLNEGQISEEEYNRYMFANEQEHLKERQNLRRKWLDSDHEFMTEGVKDLMKGVDFQKLSKFLKGMGQDMVDGIKLNIAKDENEVEKNIRASREKVMKVLLDERPIAKVAETFTQDLADLGVLFGNADEAMLHVGEDTRQMMAERMSFLMKEAKKGYALTASELLKDAKKTGNPSIKAWMESLSPEALSALVLKTQGFYDEYEDAVRKMIKKMEKRIEFERNQVGADGMSQNQRWEEAKKRLERQQHTQGVAESWGMAGNNVAGVAASENMQVDALQKELEIKRELYELEKVRYAQELDAIKQRIYMEGDPEERASLIEEAEALKTAAVKAEAEAWQGVEEAQRNATQAQFELMSQTVDQIKPYYDDLNSFAENFGENIFGSKADRQQAARDLLASVIKTTGQMLTQWLVYVSTKQMFDKMEVMNEQAKQSQLLAIKLKAQAAEMQALGKTAQAEETVKLAQNATDAARAQDKEAAKAGWIGWAIGAGLSLLMTMVFSALSAKAKGAIASATGVSGSGKLATGMLTYGKGRYPVYAEGVYANDGSGRTQGQLVSVPGNDGRTYMAKYQPNLKTGVVNSPHLGIVGEKGAELIVDHQTYEGLRRYDPETLRRIYAMRAYGTRSIDFERTARMGNEVVMNRGGVRAYADGNIDEKLGGMDDGTNAYDGTMVEMKQTLADLTVVLATIKETGIDAHMNYFGRNGAWETDKRGQKFLKRKGIT